ncbi:unnamed protein product [Candidula unifasciata]|uniref:Uncharacterized protein n=1 Tax=Candidula unifasciata TaxID=100452 RepID=A0A8S3YVN5_9EUPU|nr:unnamed protein product [Candidula unifasciata]
MTSQQQSSHEQNSTKQRINMAHGFMKSVIRNQIDRDNYDKEVKARQQQGRSHYRPNANRPRKPEIQTYIPPQRTKKDIGQYLFTLEYEHKNGELYSLHISKIDTADEVARRIGDRFELPDTFTDALAQRIQEEMDKRAG